MAKTRGGFVKGVETGGIQEQVVADLPALNEKSTTATTTPQDKKEEEALRAQATERAALSYLEQKRGGNNKASVRDCCDAAAAETGYPRPAETSVRRMLPRFMTDEEKSEKKRQDEQIERRAAATKAAALLYRQTNGDGDGDVVMSVPQCCALAQEQHGIRPAETSVRRVLARMYEDEGIEPKKKKAKPTPKIAKPRARSVQNQILQNQSPQISAQHDLQILQAYQPNQPTILPASVDAPQDSDYLLPPAHQPSQQMFSPVADEAIPPAQDVPDPPDMPPLPEPEVDVVAV